MKILKFLTSTTFSLTTVAISAVALTAVSINDARIQEQDAKYRKMLGQAMVESLAGEDSTQQVDALGIVQSVPSNRLPINASANFGSMAEGKALYDKVILKDPPMAIPLLPVTEFGYTLILEKTKNIIPKTKDPIWELSVVNQTGEKLGTLKALSGRSYRQTANRNKSGNKSPLPVGIYSIDDYRIERGPFDDIELGEGFWVPITPLFATGRTDLGFHQDLSWGKVNGESGTDGCIGLDSAESVSRLVQWIKYYQIKRLVVNS